MFLLFVTASADATSTMSATVTGNQTKSVPVFDSCYFFHKDSLVKFFTQFAGLRVATYNSDEDYEAFLAMRLSPKVTGLFAEGPVNKSYKGFETAVIPWLKEFERRVQVGDCRAPLTFRNRDGNIVGFAWLDLPKVHQVPIHVTHMAELYLCLCEKYLHEGYGPKIGFFLKDIFLPEVRRLGAIEAQRRTEIVIQYSRKGLGLDNISQELDKTHPPRFTTFYRNTPALKAFATVPIDHILVLNLLDAFGNTYPYLESFVNNEGLTVQAREYSNRRALLEVAGKDKAPQFLFAFDIPELSASPDLSVLDPILAMLEAKPKKQAEAVAATTHNAAEAAVKGDPQPAAAE